MVHIHPTITNGSHTSHDFKWFPYIEWLQMVHIIEWLQMVLINQRLQMVQTVQNVKQWASMLSEHT